MECDLCDAINYEKYLKKQLELYLNHNVSDYKNCYYTPDIIHVKDKQKVYCLGDLHGDFDVMFYSLVEANLIREFDGDWIGGDSVIIQLGDILDGQRNDRSVDYAGEKIILNFLKRLHIKALEHGGMVITCLGNHDIYRLLCKYNKDGSPILPNANSFYIKRRNNLSWKRSYYNVGIADKYPIDAFTSVHGNKDFNNNRSLSNLIDPNQYLDDDHGFHRQMLASCSSKLLVKVIWDNKIGLMCSHGEKTDQFLQNLKMYFVNQLIKINIQYKNWVTFDTIFDNPDHLIIFINSLFSFFLRVYQNTTATHNQPFRQMIIGFLDMLSAHPKNGSFILCYLAGNYSKVQLCEESSKFLISMGLDPLKSSCVSGHSGSNNGFIRVNKNGWCHNIIDTSNSIHSNTTVMTDVHASRCFDIPGIPQIVEVKLVNPRNPTLKFKVIESFELDENGQLLSLDDRISFHNSKSILQNTTNPQNLKTLFLPKKV